MIPEGADPKDYVAVQLRRNGGGMHPMTITDLFNELHRRLTQEAEHYLANKRPGSGQLMADLSDQVDAAHHTYTDLIYP